jgi:hypothetical protein
MANYRQFLQHVLCLAGLLIAGSAQAGTDDELLAGPAYAKFRLTLTPGWREEEGGPFFYEQDASGQTQWAIPPFFCRTLTPEVDWSEWEFFYPVVNYRRFGKEYRLQFGQVLSFSGGQTPQEDSVRHTTLFPFYFRQHSTETNHDYTAVFPLYGHLENRMFRNDIKFVMFPLFSETRKKDVVTDNYLYPIFDRRRGDGLTGWEVWPLAGDDRKSTTFRTNSMGDVGTIGGYDKFFALWPFYFDSHAGLDTTNPASSLTMVPFYSQTRSPSRDESSYGFPLGFNAIHDRQQNYVEHDFIWPLFVWAHGSKTVTRYFPFYSRARHNGLESVFYGFFLYKFNRLEAPPLDRHRTRVLYCLYNDTWSETPNRMSLNAASIFGRSIAIAATWTEIGACRFLRFWSRYSPTIGPSPGSTLRFGRCGERRKTPAPAPPASRCCGICTGTKASDSQKKPRSCSGFFSINPHQTGAAGVWARLNLGGKPARATVAKS